MVASITPPDAVELVSLEEFLSHQSDRTEWVDGKLIEKTGLTIKHGLAQAKLILQIVSLRLPIIRRLDTARLTLSVYPRYL